MKFRDRIRSTLRMTRLERISNRELLARQTRATEFAAISTAVFSGLIVLISALQWRANDQATKLSYALSSPRFEIVSPKEPAGVRPSTEMKVRASPGVAHIIGVDFFPVFIIEYRTGAQVRLCHVLVVNYFQNSDNPLDARSTPLADELVSTNRLPMIRADIEGRAVKDVEPYPHLLALPFVRVEVMYEDVWGKMRNKTMAWSGGYSDDDEAFNYDDVVELTKNRLGQIAFSKFNATIPLKTPRDCALLYAMLQAPGSFAGGRSPPAQIAPQP